MSHGFDPAAAYKRDFPMHDFHFLTAKELPASVTFKIRHTPEFHKAALEQTAPGCYTVHAEEMIQGVAPGQFCVIYDADHHRCYGSGEIAWG